MKSDSREGAGGYLACTEVVFSSPQGRTTTRDSSLSTRFSFCSMVGPGNHWDKAAESRFFNPGGDGALLLVDTLLFRGHTDRRFFLSFSSSDL